MTPGKPKPGLVTILFMLALLIAMAGFLTHMYVDLWDLTWDAWANLID